MSLPKTSIHGEWSSRLAFILAATGSAVGLGNIWKFPYMTGEYGGGAFVIVYLLCIALIGLPIMMAEVMLGKRGRSSPINTMQALAQETGRSQIWQLLGWSGVIAGFLILSFYSVIAGWALAYVPRLASGMFTVVSDLPTANAVADFVDTQFNALVGDPLRLLAWHTAFIIVTITMVAGGVQGGLERAVRWMMPALFILLLVLVGYAMSTPKFMDGVHFMFNIDFDKLLYSKGEFRYDGILAAMGQAFFSLSLGMGSIMVYGAYLPKQASIAQTTTAVVVADTLVAILAGLIIFPIVFSNGLQPDAGVGLVFKTLPIAFGQMPFGSFFGTVFFVLLALAAWSSAISLIEPAVAWLVETGKFTRLSATIGCGLAAWLVGLATVFSFNIWSDIKPLSQFASFEDKTLFDLIDYLTTNIMLPLGGLFIAIFVAWIMKRQIVSDEFKSSPNRLGFQVWYFLLRYLTPLGIGLVFLNTIGVFS
ncbi:MAG: sodium-dependent transporter [Candidatus Parabeggiatoa sp. nov. 3]|nr:MAG: sodium-dependent transporter [Gammaproteobacteria bacterium]RKZ64469.1 MAG: sodium-dependent transporter [Gammaproteobacteria bacterium]RKZ82653.1 MAG: sodium-dependent transporter [Gammaproteobacteria bacterium]